MWSTTRIKKTRKRHLCSWCPEMIEKGSTAIKFASVWEGDFCSGYFHPECNAACDEEMKDPENKEGVEFGAMATRKRGSQEEY